MSFNMLSPTSMKPVVFVRTLRSAREDSGIIFVKRFGELGVNLYITPLPKQYECIACGERWAANVVQDMSCYPVQRNLPGMEERFGAPYLCLNGSNKNNRIDGGAIE